MTSSHVMDYLAKAELREENVWLRDDIRIAWLTVNYAATGEAKLCAPNVLATYMVLGVHPDQVFRKIYAYRQWMLGYPIQISARRRRTAAPATATSERKVLTMPAPKNAA